MAKPVDAQEVILEFAGPQAVHRMAIEIKWLRESLSMVGWFPRDGTEFPGRGIGR